VNEPRRFCAKTVGDVWCLCRCSVHHHLWCNLAGRCALDQPENSQRTHTKNFTWSTLTAAPLWRLTVSLIYCIVFVLLCVYALFQALLGAPGVGKGTFASRLGPHFGIPAISTGDLIRAEIKTASTLGRQLKAITDAGRLVSDEVMSEILKKRLSLADTARGFLLDGYPRRVTQAEALNRIQPLDAVVNIGLREDILINKISSRRVCEKCGANFNLANIQDGEINMPPLLPKGRPCA
jgi:adenylate kinase family enzyme